MQHFAYAPPRSWLAQRHSTGVPDRADTVYTPNTATAQEGAELGFWPIHPLPSLTVLRFAVLLRGPAWTVIVIVGISRGHGSVILSKYLPFMIDPRPVHKFISTRTPLMAKETTTQESKSTNTANPSSPLTEDEFLYQRPNRIRPPSKNTSNVYLHRIHSLLYPPPPSEIAAFAHRIPKLPKDIVSQPDSLKWVERCLVSPSFWQGIEEGMFGSMI
ncbi:hypothetical protein PCASD_03719 [Puccinia coronata f. sp. avenae]|uniref:Uncharacterized protein n=1 Tax=Puccinia coronata f. sp. avenae TaxID=200324 RepID=A0A2N5V9K4_9BASI|nr:hypothetical protein PCASD_03719 [Puccinia coronata f. sp. avenae]